MMLFISILCFVFAGVSEAIMDTLQFHYTYSKFYHLNNKRFWNPQISWANKYKNNDPTMGPKFIGSTTIFVGFTDGWHLFKLLRNLFIFVGIFFIAIIPTTNIWLFMYILILRMLFGISFTLLFRILSN